jgi:hypothetical protein
VSGEITPEINTDAPSMVEVDTNVAHAARIYDYLMGGKHNFEVDRVAAERATAAQGGIDKVRAHVRKNREFLGLAVRYLAGEQGVDQFLDIGTGIPYEGNVHEVAQQVVPDARVLYVDNDPVVLAHAHRLLHSEPTGTTACLGADLRDPRTILEQAAATLDLTKPTAVLLLAVLHFVPDDDDPYRVVDRLMQAVPSGSYLVMSHLASDIHPEGQTSMASRFNELGPRHTMAIRSRAEVARFFDGLEILEPGVVPLDRWHLPGERPSPLEDAAPVHAAVGRKP